MKRGRPAPRQPSPEYLAARQLLVEWGRRLAERDALPASARGVLRDELRAFGDRAERAANELRVIAGLGPYWSAIEDAWQRHAPAHVDGSQLERVTLEASMYMTALASAVRQRADEEPALQARPGQRQVALGFVRLRWQHGFHRPALTVGGSDVRDLLDVLTEAGMASEATSEDNVKRLLAEALKDFDPHMQDPYDFEPRARP